MGRELRIAAGVVLKSIDQDEDKKNGFRTSYTFTGTRTECEQQRLLERSRGATSLSLKPNGDGNWELVTTYPTDAENGDGAADQPTDTHDLDSSMAQQDVFTNPKLCSAPAVGGLSEANRITLKHYVDQYKRGDFKTTIEAKTALMADTINDGAPNIAAARARMVAYFELIALKGVDHWIFYRSIYSRIITSATPRQVQASFEGAQKLWTTAQLLAWENLPNEWWFQLPPGTVWHKSVPKVSTNIGKDRKTQIQYQYIGSDEASPMLY